MGGNSIMSSQRAYTSQTAEINVPISVAWDHLSAFDEWHQWNPSVRLPADYVLGQPCKAKIVASSTKRRNSANSKSGGDGGSEGKAVATPPNKKRWTVTNCTIDEVGNLKHYAITWTIRRGLFKNVACMMLTSFAGTRKTTLTYTQSIQGPPFSLAGSSRDLLMNSSCINQCFKNHVECLHFQSLLMDASSRNTSGGGTYTHKKRISCHSSTSLTGREEDEEESTTADSEDFWTSSAQVRHAVVSQFVEEAVPDSYCVVLKS